MSSIKNGSFDYSISLKSDIDKFYKKNAECSPLLFEYILYTIVNNKLKNNIQINPNLILISEDYYSKKKETIIKIDNEKYFNDKIFLIIYFDKSNNKWGLIILYKFLPLKENDEINTKIIANNTNENIKNAENIINNILKKIKISNNLNNKKIQYKNDIYDISNIPNTSKFILNFLKKVFDYPKSNIYEYIIQLFKDIDINIEEYYNDKIFKDLNVYYDREYNAYINNKINEKNDIMSTNNINDINGEVIKTNNKILEIHENNIKDKKDEKEIIYEEDTDDLDELARKLVNNIMNLKYDKSKESKNKELNIIEEDDKKEENKSADEIFDFNMNNFNLENNCHNKKIDEVTKNTIDDILDSVLKDMKVGKNKYKKKSFKYLTNKMQNKYRLKTINIEQKIDTIEEEDKESSTSEIKTDKKADNININKDDKKNDNNKEEIRFSNKINNSFEFERRPSLFSYNQEKNDDNKIKEGEIYFEDENIIQQKDNNNEKKSEIEYNNLNINKDNNNDNINYEDNINDNLNINNYKYINSKKENNNLNNDYLINKENINKNEINEINIEKEGREINEIIIEKEEREINNDINDTIENSYKNKNDFGINDNISNNDTITISNNNSVIDNEMDVNIDLSNYDNNNNFEIINDEKINLRSSSPKDNIKNKKNKTQPPFILKNIISNKTKNNININTINAKNIIIINNTIYHNNNSNTIKKPQIKKEKEPEDEIVPKDNKRKKKNKNSLDLREPCDTKYDPEKIKFLVKQTFRNNESRYNTRTINIDKQIYRDKQLYNDISRSYNDIQNLKNIINENYYYETDYIKPHHSNKTFTNINLDLGKKNTIYTQKTYYHPNTPIRNINNQFNYDKKNSKYSTFTEKNKINKKEINNKDKKYPLFKNYNNSNSNRLLKSKTLDYSNSTKIKPKRQFPQIPQNNKNIIDQKLNENNNVNEDNCILF